MRLKQLPRELAMVSSAAFNSLVKLKLQAEQGVAAVFDMEIAQAA